MVCLVGVKRLEVVRGIVWLTANETAEKGGDDCLRDDDLVVNRSSLEMEKFHANRLSLKDVADVISVDSVLAYESLEDVKTLGGELVNTSLPKEVGCGIYGVLYEAGIHKMLAHGFGHVPRHGKSGRCCRCDDAGRLSGVWSTIRLGELERCEILSGLLARKKQMMGELEGIGRQD